METVSYDAAYGGERVTALVFLPRNTAPPFQTVIWFPGSDVYARRSHESLASEYLFDFIPRSGRALVYPIYKGMYERFVSLPRTPNERRDRLVYWSKDLSRTIDYLETRADIDSERLAYYGVSTTHLGPFSLRLTRSSRPACSSLEVSLLLGPGDPRRTWSTSLRALSCLRS